MSRCSIQYFLCSLSYHSSDLHMDIWHTHKKITVGLSAVIRYDCFLRQLNVMVKMRCKQISEEFHWLSRNIKSMNWRTVLCVDLNGKFDCKLKHERKDKINMYQWRKWELYSIVLAYKSNENGLCMETQAPNIKHTTCYTHQITAFYLISIDSPWIF